MYIPRDITKQFIQNPNWAQVLLGPRQCGKSTLFAALFEQKNHKKFQEITFDDLQMRHLANNDPELFLQQFKPPLLLDEVQYAPGIFTEIKKIIDQIKRKITFGSKISPEVLFRLTGSNQILMDKQVKESLVGRASYFFLNTLTVHEILNAFPELGINDIIFKGGWPELYINNTLSITQYLNDYIRSYVEKDIILSAGIQKISEFHTVLGLLAARTGQLIDYSDIAKDSGIRSITVKEWSGLLERADLIYFLKPYYTNLNKRLIKTPKIYFLDTGLAVRLQGWSEPLALFNSPQAGSLFETLVLAEIIKFIRNYSKDWELFFWRTKEGEEIDFVLQTNKNTVHAFEAKRSIGGITEAMSYPKSYEKQFGSNTPLTIVTFGGKSLKLSKLCQSVPIAQLHDYLMNI